MMKTPYKLPKYINLIYNANLWRYSVTIATFKNGTNIKFKIFQLLIIYII